jgi:hypothetical protein
MPPSITTCMGKYDKAADNLAQGYEDNGQVQEAAAIRQSFKGGGFTAVLHKRVEIEKMKPRLMIICSCRKLTCCWV